MEYCCKGCDYKTIYHTNYKKHLETKKHKDLVEHFVCKFCEKEFKFRQSMYRHAKYTCKKNKDVHADVKDEVKDLVRLLKEEGEKREELQKQIEQLSEKLEHNLKT